MALRRGQASFVQLAFENRRYALISRSLNTQEVGVAVQSIGTSIERRDVAGDHLLVPAREVPFGEMDGVGEIDDLAQEVGARTKTLDNARDLLPAGACAPVVVGGERATGGFGVFGNFDLRGTWRGWSVGLQVLGFAVFVIPRHALSCILVLYSGFYSIREVGEERTNRSRNRPQWPRSSVG